MRYKVINITFTTSTNAPHTTPNICRHLIFQVMNDISVFVGFLALVVGVAGYTTSICALIIEWIFPSTISKMPKRVKRPARRTSRPVAIVAHKEAPAPAAVELPSLRRHSSFHPPPVPMTDCAPRRPFYNRRVTFDLLPSKKFIRAQLSKTSSPLSAFKSKDIAEDSDFSRRSSPRSDSGTIVSDVHSSSSMDPLDLEIRPAFPIGTMDSPRPSVGKCLHSLKNPFNTVRRMSSSSVSAVTAQFQPELRSEVLRSNLNQESPYFPTMPSLRTVSRPRTDSTISGGSRRSALGLLVSNQTPKSPLVDQQQVKSRVPPRRFSKPWPTRGTTRAQPPSPPPEYTPGPPSSRRTFIGLFSSSKPSSPLLEEPESPYFSVNLAQSNFPIDHGAQAYASPFNAPIPSGASNGSDRGCSASDPVLKYTERKPRQLKPKRIPPPKWPVENMIEILDEKLFAAQEAQMFEDGFQPKRYIWADNNTPPVSHVPDVSYAHSTPSHMWAVRGESWGRGSQ